jgi:hypothetical protein
MRMVSIDIRDINDGRILSSVKSVNVTTLDAADFPEEWLYQVYIEAKEELEEALDKERDEAERIRDDR